MGLTNKFERKLFFVFGRHIWNVIGVSGFVALLTGAILFADSYLIESIKSRKEYLGSAYVIKPKREYLGDSLITIKSKKEYFGNDLVTIKSKEEYFGNDLITKQNLIPLAKDSGDIKTYETWLEENKGKGNQLGYKGRMNWYWTVLDANDLDKDQDAMYESYKRNSYENYMRNSIPSDLMDKLNSQDEVYLDYKRPLLKKQKSQDELYSNYKRPLLQKQYEQDQFYKRYKLAQINKIESQEKNYQNYVNKISARNSVKVIQRGSSLLVTAWGFGVVSTSSIISSIFSIERNTRNNDV